MKPHICIPVASPEGVGVHRGTQQGGQENATHGFTKMMVCSASATVEGAHAQSGQVCPHLVHHQSLQRKRLVSSNSWTGKLYKKAGSGNGADLNRE